MAQRKKQLSDIETESKAPSYTVDPEFYDFRNFLAYVWDFLNLPPPSETQRDIALYLQGGVYLKNGNRASSDKSNYSSETQYKIIQAWRGLGKTWITATYACWILYLDPHKKIIVASAAESHALKVLHFVRQLLDKVDVLQPLVPIKGCRDSLSQGTDVAQALDAPSVQPSLFCGGISSSWPGNRANLIIADDVETPINSRTDKTREDLLGQISEFKNMLVEGGKVIMLGTAQSVDSIYFTDLVEKEGYDLKIWPVRIPTEAQLENDLYRENLGCYIRHLIDLKVPAGTAHDERWTEGYLAEKKLSRTQELLQFMLDTSQNDTQLYPLKVADLIVMPLDLEQIPEYIVWSNGDEYRLPIQSQGVKGDSFYKPAAISDSYRRYGLKIMSIDPSGRGSDRTGYTILYESNSKLFLLDAGGLKGGYEDVDLLQLVMTAKKYNVDGIVVEPNFGGGMFTRLLSPVLKRNYHCALIESVSSQSNKNQRIIDTLEPVFNQHRLVVSEDLARKDASEPEKNHRLFRQVTRINRVKNCLQHDDVIDALAIGVQYLAQKLTAHDIYNVHQREFEDEYKRMENQLFGFIKETRNFNWLDDY